MKIFQASAPARCASRAALLLASLLAGCGLIFGNARGGSPDALVAAATTDIKELEELILIYRRQRGHLPSALAQIRLAQHAWVDRPLDPWGAPYFYRVGQGRHGFLVGSLGADARPGGQGEARDLDNDLLAGR